MTTSQPMHHDTHLQTGRPSTWAIARRGALAGAAAAIATTALAALARAADVSLEVDSTAVPIAAFAWWTLVGAALGILMARFLRTRRLFVGVTIVATGLSLIPPIALPEDLVTKTLLVAAHLLAAAIIIPSLSRGLPEVPAIRGSQDR